MVGAAWNPQGVLSYAHEDVDIALNLQKHLTPLRHEQIVEFWYDRDLVAGESWDDEIASRLEHADIVVVLLSSDFVASEYAYGKELSRALELHDRGQLRLVPVIARNCRWQNLPIGRLQALPESVRPITSWSDRDDAYVTVALGIEEVARQLLSAGSGLADDWLTSRLLRRRMIRVVQQQLARLGFYAGPIDGIPGRNTEAAVVRFQRAQRLTLDAMIGPEVIQRLDECVAASEPDGPRDGGRSGRHSDLAGRRSGLTDQHLGRISLGRVPSVELFVDPSRHWAWVTSRWITEVAPTGSLR